MPFGKQIKRNPSFRFFDTVGNVLWFLFTGLWIFLSHVSLVIALAVTIIGIPFAVQHLKLALFALWPFGSVAR